MESVLNYLDKARQKPEAARKRLAILWTVGLTVLVVGAWVVNMIYFLPNPLGQETVVENVPAKPAESPAGFAGTHLTRIKNGFSVVVDKVSGLVK